VINLGKEAEFNRICRDIKSLKIQGAENVAKEGLRAYSLLPTRESIKKLSSLRPTEPMLFNSLSLAEKYGVEKVLDYISKADREIAREGIRLVRKNSIIFTHCHSSSVMNIMKEAKKNHRKFEVFNTETRPLYQGKKTAMELARAKIHVTTFVDSLAAIALTKNSILKKSNFMLIGADALLVKNHELVGVINKIGSNMFAEIAKEHRIPVYIAANSLKLTEKNIKIEKRAQKEVWNEKSRYINTINPAFEVVEPKFIKKIVCEFGIVSPIKMINMAQKVWGF
jgi:translation initiation factor 2B subunit (eIF-2B alpha/beta/delta family)